METMRTTIVINILFASSNTLINKIQQKYFNAKFSNIGPMDDLLLYGISYYSICVNSASVERLIFVMAFFYSKQCNKLKVNSKVLATCQI